MITLKPYSYRTSFKIFIMISLFFCSSCNQSNISEPEPPCIDCPINFRVIDSEPAWSPDGKTIAYLHGDIDPEKHGLYLIDTSGENNRILLQGKYFDSPSWSPDGEWIAISMGKQIYKIKKNGSQLTQLTFNGRNFSPAWSPDINIIAYSNNDCGDQLQPPADDECGTRIFNLKNDSTFFTLKYGRPYSWINNNEFISSTRAITGNGNVLGDSVWKYNLINKNKEFLFFLKGLTEIRFLKYNTLKEEIIFTSSIGYTFTNVFKVNPDGTGFKKISNSHGYSQDFSPNGDLIVYTKSDTLNGNLWIMNRDGIDIKPLTKIGGD